MGKFFEAHSELVDIEQLELKSFARSIAEIEWLLLVLVILYYLAPDTRVDSPEGFVIAMVGFAFFVFGFHYLNANMEQKRWKLALETWVMIVFITWIVWNSGGIDSILINLYLLVIIASAITLGKLVTVLEIVLIGAVYFLMAASDNAGYTYTEFSRVMIYFSLFVLVAYVTSTLVADLYKSKRMFQSLAESDELTGLLNQRSFHAVFERAKTRAYENIDALSIMMIDIDNCKHVNDEYGHEVGDRVVTLVADTVTGGIRNQGIVCRYNGDVFVVVLPSLPAAKVMELAQRIRKAVANTSFDAAGARIVTTVSIGIASYPAHVGDVQQLLEKADEARYLCKRTGRNKVMHFEAEISPVST